MNTDTEKGATRKKGAPKKKVAARKKGTNTGTDKRYCWIIITLIYLWLCAL